MKKNLTLIALAALATLSGCAAPGGTYIVPPIAAAAPKPAKVYPTMAKAVGVVNTCSVEANRGMGGFVLMGGIDSANRLYACAPGAGLTIKAVPRNFASVMISSLCDVTKPVSQSPGEDDRVTSYCTYKGPTGLPPSIGGVPLLVAKQ